MAVSRQQDYFEPSKLYTPSQLAQPRVLYDRESSAATCPGTAMAYPLLQSPFRPGYHSTQPQWSMPQNPMSNNLFHSHNSPWEQQLAANSMAWTKLPSEPLTQEVLPTNSNLQYSYDATLDKPISFEGSSFWAPNDMSNDLAPSPSADVLLSPVSPFSDVKNTYSPGPDYSPVIPAHGSIDCTMPPSALKVSLSPSFVPPTPQSIIRQHSEYATARVTFGVPKAPAAPPKTNNVIEQSEDVSMYGSEYSYGQSQGSGPGSTQWLPPDYDIGKAAVAHDFGQHRLSPPQIDRRPNSFLVSLDRNTRQRQGQWSNTTDVPAQSHFQTRFMMPLTDSEKAQRSKDDETLIRMKQDGYTYRDIRKALGRKVAESTLRGRYRSLTKPRKDRLRAPKWQEIDIELLKRYVQEEFDRLEVTQPSLEQKQKPDKIPWMKIVEMIALNGGSYKFGAATAKKKWFEVTRPSSTRSSRRRSQA